MLKLVLFALGLATGAAAATSWLLAEPGPPDTSSRPISGDSLEVRLKNLKVQVQQALTEGERAAQTSEELLRRKLEAYRKGSTAVAIS